MLRLLCVFVIIIHCGNLQSTEIFQEFQRIFNYNDIDIKVILQKSYDFIIVGAGSAGCVVANRLSENSKWSVLLLEAGSDENFFTDIPLMSAFQSSTGYNWGYKSEKSNKFCLSLKNGRCNVPRGKALGGTSVINFLLYNRGNKLDYEEWKNNGNIGWGYEEVLPYFIKSENCTLDLGFDSKFHGKNGYLDVRHPPFHTPLYDRFIKAGRTMGFEQSDPNGYLQMGFSKVQATMQNGRRCSTAKAFLKPIKYRSNLKILTKARVTKILINRDDRLANAVEVIKDGIKHRVKAKKEVILSAGAINSPQLLMLSGIGPREDLERFNISVLQNLKVGYNLQDHISFVQTLLINESIHVSDLKMQNPIHAFNYILNGKGPLTIPGGAEALAFVKTKKNINKTNDYPDIEIVLGAAGANNDFYGIFRNILNIPNNLFYDLYGPILFSPAFSLSTILLKPRSKGRVTIKSVNPWHSPLINLNYFEDKFDLQVMIEGLRLVSQ